MEIRIDKVDDPAEFPISFENNYTYRQPTASTDGASFPAIPRLRYFAMTTVIALGTVSLGSQPPNLSVLENRRIVVLGVQPEEVVTLAEQYSRLREEIAASGMPMLGDEELRNEIRERRGVRPGRER